MTKISISKPNEKQRLFLLSEKRYIAYGGARGGGKSWAVRIKAELMALNYAGIKVCIVRRTYPELVANHINEMRPFLREVAKYNGQDKEFTFINGSKIKFQYCRNDADLDHFQGCEYDIIFIDEATQFTEHQFRMMDACVRGVNGFPKRLYLTCNPGGIGHGWVKRLFIQRKFSENENPDEYEFIQALPTDNKVLMKMHPKYIEQLKALPPKLRKAWLEGSWDIFEGQFFEEFMDNPDGYETRQWTHVIKPFRIPRSWQIYRSYDFGYAKPFSVGWWAVDHEGILYRIRELYGCTETPNEGVKWIPEKQFARIKEIEELDPNLQGRNILGVADPAIWEKSTGPSIFEKACAAGVYFQKADNKRIPGWMQVHYRLAFDTYGIPGMYAFDTCKAFIRTMPLMCYDEHEVEDVDTTLEDHCPDEVRYMCMARPISPRLPEVEKEIADDPLNMLEKKRRGK